jgi:hypothetical protein
MAEDEGQHPGQHDLAGLGVDETVTPKHAISTSDRVGHTGPGQVADFGARDTSTEDPAAGSTDDQAQAEAQAKEPERRPGGPEDNPEGLAPKAGYPSPDPRAEDRPYTAGGPAG